MTPAQIRAVSDLGINLTDLEGKLDRYGESATKDSELLAILEVVRGGFQACADFFDTLKDD